MFQNSVHFSSSETNPPYPALIVPKAAQFFIPGLSVGYSRTKEPTHENHTLHRAEFPHADGVQCHGGGRDEVAILAVSVPIVALAGLFVFLTLRYFQSKVQRAAIEQGQPVPLSQPTDARKPGLILIAVGFGYVVAASSGFGGPLPRHLLFHGVWGFIPLFIGISLLVFHYLKAREDRSYEEKSEAAGGNAAASPPATRSASDPQDA